MIVSQVRSRAVYSDVTHSHLTPSEAIDSEAYSDLYPAITAVGRVVICLSGWGVMVIEFSVIANWRRRPSLSGLQHERQKNKNSFPYTLVVNRAAISRVAIACRSSATSDKWQSDEESFG